ncbi:unnamed protein product [Amaranthus hypochondriacus]
MSEIEGGENLDRFSMLSIMVKEYAKMPLQSRLVATPLLELSFISVSSDFFRRCSLKKYINRLGSLQKKIHVTIKVIDNDSQEFLLFDSDDCDACVMDFHDDKLDIRLEKSKFNRPHWIPKHLDLKLLIKDKKDKMNEVVEIFRLDVEPTRPKPNVVYDEELRLDLEGKSFKHVQVHYTYFRYAMLAFVDCCVLKNDDIGPGDGSEDRLVKVSGAISARFKVRDKPITRSLLDEKNGNFAVFDHAQLHWSSCLAVPAYSSLEIIIDNMVVNQENIDTSYSEHDLIFKPMVDYEETVEIVGPHSKWRFSVTVKWRHAYNLLPNLCECDFSDEEEEEEEFEEDDMLQPFELPKSDVNVIMNRRDPLAVLDLYHLKLVEVFSICVCPYVGDRSFILGGTVEYTDCMGTHEVFNGDKQPSRLYPHQTLPMMEPRCCYTGTNIQMFFDLNDKEGRQLSLGCFSWDFVTITQWYNRRMCSIVRGKDGFAAVHYTAFSDATQAVVSVSFVSTEDRQYQVRGTILARYGCYRYRTQYDRRYYRSVLFEKGKDYVVLKNGEELPLLKRVVAVPLPVRLVVVVNLNVVVGGREEIVRGTARFASQRMTLEYETNSIEQLDYKLAVSVRWG